MENNYEKVIALVPEGEHFDSSAINEGVFLTEGHLANIEVSLKNQDTVVQQMQAQIDQATAATTAAQETITAHETAIAAKDTEISNLQAEIATLKKGPAGDFKATVKEKDEHGDGGAKQLDPITVEANKKREAMGLKPVA